MKALDIIKKYSEGLWDRHDLSSIDDFCTDNIKAHSPVRTISGKENMKEVMQLWYTAFPDLKVHWDDFICEDNKVVSRWHTTGTHMGVFLGIEPTNASISYRGVTIYHLDNDRIFEYYAYVDINHIKEQLV